MCSGGVLARQFLNFVKLNTLYRNRCRQGGAGEGTTTPFTRTLGYRPPAPEGLHARAPSFATWTSYARRALAGAKTNPKLTSQSDHSIRAGHNDSAVLLVSCRPGRAWCERSSRAVEIRTLMFIFLAVRSPVHQFIGLFATRA